MDYLYYRAVNWNETEDAKDQAVWLKLTNNFWLDGRVPITGDRTFWNQLTTIQQDSIGHQLAAMSMLTAFESEIGTPSLRDSNLTQQEEAVLNIITFMESVHTKAVTTIFRGLLSKEQAAQYFQWADDNNNLQAEIAVLTAACCQSNGLVRRAAFILTETMLMDGKLATIAQYSGLRGTNQMLKNIMTGQAIFTDYLGYKFREALRSLTTTERQTAIKKVNQLTHSLWLIENHFLDKQASNSKAKAVQWGRNAAKRLIFGKSQPETTARLDDPFLLLLKNAQAQAEKTPVDPEIVDADAIEAMSNDDYDF